MSLMEDLANAGEKIGKILSCDTLEQAAAVAFGEDVEPPTAAATPEAQAARAPAPAAGATGGTVTPIRREGAPAVSPLADTLPPDKAPAP
jgi:hypothetical protein